MKEVVFTISESKGKFELRTKLLMFVDLNQECPKHDLFKCMKDISFRTGQEGYACLFDVE